jgi:hypothetical protein
MEILDFNSELSHNESHPLACNMMLCSTKSIVKSVDVKIDSSFGITILSVNY